MIQILVSVEPCCIGCFIKFEYFVSIERNLLKRIFHVVSQLIARLEEGIAEHVDSVNHSLNVVRRCLEIFSLDLIGSSENFRALSGQPCAIIGLAKLSHGE